ncbi:P-loop containing nucleoside triphosphate hydrolase protein [Xylariales sp. AK1849]|nr:P-loop containing nucleoside triphosphate hydrolase protein [Xylariales sp. AK1849]
MCVSTTPTSINNMYSRYIPPSKGAPSVTLPAAPSAGVNPGAYSRYIPPPKPASKQHLQLDDSDTVEPPAKRARVEDAAEEEGAHEMRKKGKKDKKHKKTKRSPDTTVENVAVLEHVTEQAATTTQADETTGTTRVKREKKKSRAREDPKPNEQEMLSKDDEAQNRHQSVLKKKQKSLRTPEATQDPTNDTKVDDVPMEDVPEVPEVHGLEPLPQPAPVMLDTTKPSYETLPSWLAEPIRVSREAAAPFTQLGLTPELGITAELATRLAAKGYKEAFAIQTAVIPQLLPHHCRTMQSDILVAAATGSGKTLAYALPMIRDLSHGNRYLTRLRGLVVLPTRELVKQAQKICEDCSGIFALDGKRRRVKVGIAMGSQPIEKEQEALIERQEKYDPEAWHQRQKRLRVRRWENYDDEDEDELLYNSEDEAVADIRRQEDQIPTLPEYVLEYKSKVDILISTPGRLVEHITNTPGFSLDYVRWLIVDEADKLLGQNFQQWIDTVIPRLHDNDSNTRNHKQSNLSGVRKVILSATMTRDLDLLDGLKLRQPKLVVLQGSGSEAANHTLPEFLRETALKADADLKPLFLLDLLQSPQLTGALETKKLPDETSSSGSSSDSDAGSDSESDSRSLKPSPISSMPSILIFTKSNETAIRLSRLLSLLSPTIESTLGTLTSTAAYSTRKQTLRAFTTGKIRIIVASDLISRGIDLPHLEHVVNYDMPTSVASYVHRVGRTARAGKSGHAWTLFTDAEARWFWKEVANEQVVRRSDKVERVRITEEKEAAFEDKKRRYEEALEALGREAGEKRR